MMGGRASGTATGPAPIMADAKLPSLHTGESDFLAIRGDKCLYVDKTPHLRGLLAVRPASVVGHIPSLEHKYQFLARPRRFGKSLLINTLEAWFQGVPPNHELADASEAAAWPGAPAGWSRPRWLWEGLDAEDWHGLHGWHPVIRLSLPLPTSLDAGEIRIGLTTHLRNVGLEWEDRGIPWGTAPCRPLPGLDVDPRDWLAFLIRELHRHYGVRPVVLVDEYDAPLVEFIGTDVDPAPVLRLLRGLYGVLKSSEADLYGVFLIGISRFSQVNLFSALNNLQDLSETDACGALCGFTEEEVAQHFDPFLRHIQELVPEFRGRDIMAELSHFYNGYRFSPEPEAPSVFNPYALLMCMHSLQSGSARRNAARGQWPAHWSSSGSPDFLVRLVRQGRIRLPNEVDGNSYQAGSSYRIDYPDYVAVMLQTGYYTLRGGGDEPLRVEYPNLEVRRTYGKELLEAYVPGGNTVPVERLGEALRTGDQEAWCRRLETLFHGIPYDNLLNEGAYRAVMHVLCQLMASFSLSEPHSWGGRSDHVVFIDDQVFVIEVKLNASVERARAQLRARGYAKPYMEGDQEVTAIYLNFNRGRNSENPPHIECEFERLHP